MPRSCRQRKCHKEGPYSAHKVVNHAAEAKGSKCRVTRSHTRQLQRVWDLLLVAAEAHQNRLCFNTYWRIVAGSYPRPPVSLAEVSPDRTSPRAASSSLARIVQHIHQSECLTDAENPHVPGQAQFAATAHTPWLVLLDSALGSQFRAQIANPGAHRSAFDHQQHTDAAASLFCSHCTHSACSHAP